MGGRPSLKYKLSLQLNKLMFGLALEIQFVRILPWIKDFHMIFVMLETSDHSLLGSD